VRSDAFDEKTEKEQSQRTIGITVLFDVMACPSQYTLYPDPVKAINQWTKTILPEATVIGEDTINDWLVPSRNNPVVYWRISSQSVKEKTFACTWMNVVLEGHVYAKNAADRLYALTFINTEMALIGHVPMEDTSPLFVKDFAFKPHQVYLSQGQMSLSGSFGLLQRNDHFSNKSTGKPLNRINIPREIVDGNGPTATIKDVSQPYVFPYEVAGSNSTGQKPDVNTIGQHSDAAAGIETDASAPYFFPYRKPKPTNGTDL
jgi:hypothetical protein